MSNTCYSNIGALDQTFNPVLESQGRLPGGGQVPGSETWAVGTQPGSVEKLIDCAGNKGKVSQRTRCLWNSQ